MTVERVLLTITTIWSIITTILVYQRRRNERLYSAKSSLFNNIVIQHVSDFIKLSEDIAALIYNFVILPVTAEFELTCTYEAIERKCEDFINSENKIYYLYNQEISKKFEEVIDNFRSSSIELLSDFYSRNISNRSFHEKFAIIKQDYFSQIGKIILSYAPTAVDSIKIEIIDYLATKENTCKYKFLPYN